MELPPIRGTYLRKTHQQKNPVQTSGVCLSGQKPSAENKDTDLFTAFDAGFCSCHRLAKCSNLGRSYWVLINTNAIKGGKTHKTLLRLIKWRVSGGLGYLIKQYFCDSRAGGGAGRHHRSHCPVNNPLQLPLRCTYAASWPSRDPRVRGALSVGTLKGQFTQN